MKGKKKRFIKPVVLGFGVMYFMVMVLSTWLVKEKFVEEYNQELEEAAVSLCRRVDGELDKENGADYEKVLKDFLWGVQDEDVQISAAFYDEKKRLLTKTTKGSAGGNTIVFTDFTRKEPTYELEDYLSLKEREELVKYEWDNIRTFSVQRPDKYRISIQVSPDKETLWAVIVQEITWKEESEIGEDEEHYKDPLDGTIYSMEIGITVDYATGEELGGRSYCETDSKIVWQWTNPLISDEKQSDGQIKSGSILFPYLNCANGSYEGWHRWAVSQYLHDYPVEGIFEWKAGAEYPEMIVDSDGLFYRGRYQLQLGMIGDPLVYMEIRMEACPWKAAVDYMKYVYLAGFVLALACMTKIIAAFHKVYDRQAVLEETRRDMTNAMAHELKTPLGIIRNFAENLAEHNLEEKRDYYLSQIIRQTEEMDRLVVEMIELSKLDSEEFALKKEEVSFLDLVREQVEKFGPVIKEKNICVQYEGKEDFRVKGDREYLSRAVWNLVCNAVDYNVLGGRITVEMGKEQCVIENTGKFLTEEELLHAFDLFYMGDKSRGKRQGHLGMGMFLTKKILGLHGLEILLGNGKEGVRATVKQAVKCRSRGYGERCGTVNQC